MFKFSDEAKAKMAEWSAFAADQRARIANLDDQNLVATTRYYMAQMSPVRWAPGEPVYDGTFFNAIVPEILRRLEERSK